MNTLQHMTMVVTTYQTSHECPKETIVDILVAGFSGQLKGWRDNYLTNAENSMKLEADETKLQEQKTNMAILGKEAASAMAVVKAQQQRLTL